MDTIGLNTVQCPDTHISVSKQDQWLYGLKAVQCPDTHICVSKTCEYDMDRQCITFKHWQKYLRNQMKWKWIESKWILSNNWPAQQDLCGREWPWAQDRRQKSLRWIQNMAMSFTQTNCKVYHLKAVVVDPTIDVFGLIRMTLRYWWFSRIMKSNNLWSVYMTMHVLLLWAWGDGPLRIHGSGATLTLPTVVPASPTLFYAVTQIQVRFLIPHKPLVV